jgi:hypothetical protein
MLKNIAHPSKQTLEHDVLLAHLNDYMALKLVANKEK